MNTPTPYCYPVEIISVYDGDSCTVNVDIGFGWRKTKLKCRLYGIDTPEIRGSSAEEKELAYAVKNIAPLVEFQRDASKATNEILMNYYDSSGRVRPAAFVLVKSQTY